MSYIRRQTKHFNVELINVLSVSGSTASWPEGSHQLIKVTELNLLTCSQHCIDSCSSKRDSLLRQYLHSARIVEGERKNQQAKHKSMPTNCCCNGKHVSGREAPNIVNAGIDCKVTIATSNCPRQSLNKDQLYNASFPLLSTRVQFYKRILKSC